MSTLAKTIYPTVFDDFLCIEQSYRSTAEIFLNLLNQKISMVRKIAIFRIVIVIVRKRRVAQGNQGPIWKGEGRHATDLCRRHAGDNLHDGLAAHQVGHNLLKLVVKVLGSHLHVVHLACLVVEPSLLWIHKDGIRRRELLEA